jgi:homoserine dehydrogenase
MSSEGGEFADVLRGAQADGLAEADPSFDVDRIDSAHKLTLLIQLAFGVRVPFDQVTVESIRHVSQYCAGFRGGESGEGGAGVTVASLRG